MRDQREWIASCVTPRNQGRSIEVRLRFLGTAPDVNDRLPMPAGFGLYVTRKGVPSVLRAMDGSAAPLVEVHATQAELETVAAWLTSDDARLPDNLVSYEITSRQWRKLLSERLRGVVA
jgi:hypothetical protein